MTQWKKILTEDDLIPYTGIGCHVKPHDQTSGTVITSGVKAYIDVPYSATITQWSVTASASGNITFDIWKKAGAVPTISDSIVGDTAPNLSGQSYNTSSDMTNWTTTISSGDVICFYISGTPTVTEVTLNLWVTKTGA